MTESFKLLWENKDLWCDQDYSINEFDYDYRFIASIKIQDLSYDVKVRDQIMTTLTNYHIVVITRNSVNRYYVKIKSRLYRLHSINVNIKIKLELHSSFSFLFYEGEILNLDEYMKKQITSNLVKIIN